MSFAIGLKALRSYCEQQSVIAYKRAKLNSNVFIVSEIPAFEWVDAHVTKFHMLPKLDTLETMFPEVKNIETPEPSAYYLSLLEDSYFHRMLNKANVDSQQVLKDDQHAWKKASAILRNTLNTITEQQYRTRIMDFGKDGVQAVYQEYHNILKSDEFAQFGWPYMDSQGGVTPGEVVSIVGRPAAGKAQPLDSKVLTLGGFKRMGDIQLGDKLASVDGGESEVTGIHPQGVKSVFVLTFQDGRTVKASGEHLWEVFYRGGDATRVETTLQLIARLHTRRHQNRPSVSLYSGEYGTPVEAPFSPYLLGVFIGDGGLTKESPVLTSADWHIVSRIRYELRVQGLDLIKQGSGPYTYGVRDDRCGGPGGVNRLSKWFVSLGLQGVKSEKKHIPEKYLSADVFTRWELLRGLMDTDGTAAKNGGVSYCTSSPRLAKGVQTLVWSLGGKATINLKQPRCLDAYILHIVVPNRVRVFSLGRKQDRVLRGRTKHTNHRLTLESIHYHGEEECQCITVSHPRRLYLSDNYVVTHNSWVSLYTALHNWRNHKNVLFVSMEMTPLHIAQRLASMYAGTNYSQLKTGEYSSITLGKFEKGLLGIAHEESKLYLVDGNLAASGEDVYTLAAQLECPVVCIDGAYLLRHKNTKLDRYTRVAENAELMKRASTDLDISTFATWQFSREASKGKKRVQDVGLEDIGYSDAIGQISSIVLGLFQEEGVETMKRRTINVMKGRSGEIGKFDINWLFNVMNFDQAQDEQEQDLGYL